ncbi:hypothetical protein B0H12DRAFT_325623 [Mycena haematopus]|nr:hypothetical protein B0H12DRAFT_325623 [Mycena haematopus]
MDSEESYNWTPDRAHTSIEPASPVPTEPASPPPPESSLLSLSQYILLEGFERPTIRFRNPVSVGPILRRADSAAAVTDESAILETNAPASHAQMTSSEPMQARQERGQPPPSMDPSTEAASQVSTPEWKPEDQILDNVSIPPLTSPLDLSSDEDYSLFLSDWYPYATSESSNPSSTSSLDLFSDGYDGAFACELQNYVQSDLSGLYPFSGGDDTSFESDAYDHAQPSPSDEPDGPVLSQGSSQRTKSNTHKEASSSRIEPDSGQFLPPNPTFPEIHPMAFDPRFHATNFDGLFPEHPDLAYGRSAELLAQDVNVPRSGSNRRRKRAAPEYSNFRKSKRLRAETHEASSSTLHRNPYIDEDEEIRNQASSSKVQLNYYQPYPQAPLEFGPNVSSRAAPRGTRSKDASAPPKKRCPCIAAEETGCIKTFSRKKDAERHLKRVHNRETVICPKCGKTLSRDDALRRHLRIGCNIEDLMRKRKDDDTK